MILFCFVWGRFRSRISKETMLQAGPKHTDVPGSLADMLNFILLEHTRTLRIRKELWLLSSLYKKALWAFVKGFLSMFGIQQGQTSQIFTFQIPKRLSWRPAARSVGQDADSEQASRRAPGFVDRVQEWAMLQHSENCWDAL